MPPKPTNTKGRVQHVVPKEATRLARQRMTELVQMVPDRPLYMALHEDTVSLALQAALPALQDSFKERVREALLGDPHTLKGIVKFMELDDRGTAEGILEAALDSEDHRG